jgi:aryl-alcohol dehydrogenase-like predicted oxidoreductase
LLISIVIEELESFYGVQEKNGIFVKLLLGTAQLTRAYGVLKAKQSEPRQSPVDLIAEAEALGYSGIDTAPVYGSAEAEIGNAESSLPVYTKLHPARSLEDSIMQSRLFLRRNYLDGAYLHEEYVASFKQNETLKLLRDRRTDVGEVGVSIYSVEEFELANLNPDIDILQVPYSIFDQRFNEDYLTRNLDPKKKVFARSVFLQGVLLRQASDLPAAVSHLAKFKTALERAARESGLDDLGMALGFAMGNRALDGVIVGTSSLKELREIASRKNYLLEEELYLGLDFDNVPTWNAVDPRKWSQ